MFMEYFPTSSRRQDAQQMIFDLQDKLVTVSYTHLDVYKRQTFVCVTKKSMDNFAAIDFETANNERTSICSVGVVIVRNGEIAYLLYTSYKVT